MRFSSACRCLCKWTLLRSSVLSVNMFVFWVLRETAPQLHCPPPRQPPDHSASARHLQTIDRTELHLLTIRDGRPVGLQAHELYPNVGTLCTTLKVPSTRHLSRSCSWLWTLPVVVGGGALSSVPVGLCVARFMALPLVRLCTFHQSMNTAPRYAPHKALLALRSALRAHTHAHVCNRSWCLQSVRYIASACWCWCFAPRSREYLELCPPT